MHHETAGREGTADLVPAGFSGGFRNSPHSFALLQRSLHSLRPALTLTGLTPQSIPAFYLLHKY